MAYFWHRKKSQQLNKSGILSKKVVLSKTDPTTLYSALKLCHCIGSPMITRITYFSQFPLVQNLERSSAFFSQQRIYEYRLFTNASFSSWYNSEEGKCGKEHKFGRKQLINTYHNQAQHVCEYQQTQHHVCRHTNTSRQHYGTGPVYNILGCHSQGYRHLRI